jgi:hypothetical protein
MPDESSQAYHVVMSNAPTRPKSTLAVDRFRAASRPLGAPLAGAAAPPDAVAVVATARAYRPEARELVSRVPLTAKSPARPAAPPAIADAPAPRATTTPAAARGQRDGLLVTSIVVAFVVVALAFGSLKISGDMQVDRSRSALGGSLAAVHQRQTEFRILNRRFATWPELEARGLTLPPSQRVVKSNATASHWFVALRDGDTGMICSRTGELFDDGPLDRAPTCSPAVR